MNLLYLVNSNFLDVNNSTHQFYRQIITRVAINILNQTIDLGGYFRREYWNNGNYIPPFRNDMLSLKWVHDNCSNNGVSPVFKNGLRGIIDISSQTKNNFKNFGQERYEKILSKIEADYNNVIGVYLSNGIIPLQMIVDAKVNKVIKNNSLDSKQNLWKQYLEEAYYILDHAESITSKANKTKLLYEVLVFAFECVTLYSTACKLLKLAMNTYQENVGKEIPKELWKEFQVVEELRVRTGEIIQYQGVNYLLFENLVVGGTDFISNKLMGNYHNLMIHSLKESRALYGIFPIHLYDLFYKILQQYKSPSNLDLNEVPNFTVFIKNLLLNTFYKAFEDKITVQTIFGFEPGMWQKFMFSSCEYSLTYAPFNLDETNAYELIVESLEISQLLKSTIQAASWYFNLGNYYFDLKEPELAKVYLTIALEEYSKIENQEKITKKIGEMIASIIK